MIERYDHITHYPLIVRWFTARKRVAPRADCLPSIGFCSDAIAIAFLITTNSKIARIENVIVDKLASQKDRGKALRILFETLEKEAAALGYTAIEILCDGETMADRLADRGFLRYGEFELYFKEIQPCLG